MGWEWIQFSTSSIRSAANTDFEEQPGSGGPLRSRGGANEEQKPWMWIELWSCLSMLIITQSSVRRSKVSVSNWFGNGKYFWFLHTIYRLPWYSSARCCVAVLLPTTLVRSKIGGCGAPRDSGSNMFSKRLRWWRSGRSLIRKHPRDNYRKQFSTPSGRFWIKKRRDLDHLQPFRKYFIQGPGGPHPQNLLRTRV